MRTCLLPAILAALLLPLVPARADKNTLPPLETRILGQRRWLRGGPAALRIVTSDHMTGRPVRADVQVYLARNEQGKPAEFGAPIFAGRTDGLGTVDARFRAPASDPGEYTLRVHVASRIGEDDVRQPIALAESTQILLACDKPLYQPGQLIHMRALALDTGTRHAVADRPATFEVEDGRGNKVFKRKTELSKFGIASADFQLADEVNMGTFTLRLVLPEGQTEKKVRVERYVLPKYKVTLTPDRTYYLPGEKASGVIKAAYFFGKPVSGGEVNVEVNTIDIGVTKLTELHGKTDGKGEYRFEYKLPDSFVGQPFEQGKAVVEFHAAVKDTADHRQETYVSTPVVKEPVQIVVVPESRAAVPGVKNRAYIAAATPDGIALKHARVEVLALPAKDEVLDHKATVLETDDLGLAAYEFTPSAQIARLQVTVEAGAGRAATTTTPISMAGADGIILRVDKPLTKVGDRVNLTALCSLKGGTTYFDVIRNKQTILTRAESASGNEAAVALPVTDDMVGTLEIRAYRILPNENIVRDSRVVVVSPADDLTLTAVADRQEYRPGGEALIHFTVADQRKQPVQAALGLAIVDESVFALSELKPGLERIYFTLEKELMEPKYEIHGLSPSYLFAPPTPLPIRESQRQRAASMLFAAATDDTQYDLGVNTYLQRWAAEAPKVVAEMTKTAQTVQAAATKYRADTKQPLPKEKLGETLAKAGYVQAGQLRDRWGRAYRLTVAGGDANPWVVLASAGPDGRWGTADDVDGVTSYGPYRTRAFGRRLGAFGGGGAGAFNGALGQVPEGLAGVDEMRLDLGVAFADKDMLAAPAEAWGLADRKELAKGATTLAASGPGGGAEPARVRSYFPETMLWNPMLVTDEAGKADLRVPLADSITTWRMSMMANTPSGQLGSGTSGIKVFQDFFVDLDLPVSLTQNDHVDIPVAVYNYLPAAQDVRLEMEKQAWFTLRGDAVQSVHVGPGEVKVVYFPITATSIGRFPLTVQARGTRSSDAVRRSVDVAPDGKEVVAAINDRLDGKTEKSLVIPEEALKGATSLWLKLYPGAFSQVVEGLDGILRMPSGCFEQTSSTTYPNVLVLDYLKTNKRINPELQMKAEGYINIGYQRLVTFECKSGGFSWFGDEPAHQILTAYGLLEFSDMAKVHDVDPAVISRTQQWLAGKQQADGSWEEKNQGIAEGIINRQTGALRATAYVAWALAETAYAGPELGKGVDYVKAHLDEAKDAYTLAIIVNLLAKVDRDGDATAKAAGKLIDMATVTANAAYWKSDTQTMTGAVSAGADLETTGLAAYGLAKWGRNAGFLNKALTYLVQSKDAFGTWQSTQGTVWSMKALLYAGKNGTGGNGGTITVLANGAKAGTVKITAEDSDVMRQVNLLEYVKPGRNDIALQYEGDGSLLYQIVGRYYLPWPNRPDGPAPGPLSIDVKYDKTTLAQDDTATVTVKIRNNTQRIAEMPLIDLGVPPGFTVVPDKLDDAVKGKTISKYTVAARQVIVYLEKLDPGQELTLDYQVKARFPIKARTPLSKAYPYYNPEQVAVSQPQDVTVTR